MKPIIALFLAVLIPQAHADPIYGIDHLGAAQYREVLVRHHPDGFAVGVFTQRDLFGDPLPALSQLVAVKRVPLIRYNLRWSDSHSFSRRDFPAIVKEAQRVAAFAARYPNMGCHVSGATEHQLRQPDALELSRQVLAVIPSFCSYVNNPWEGRGAFIPAGPRVLNEVHGSKAQPPRIGGRFNFSFDGSSAVDSDVEGIKNRLRGAEVFFLWHPANNGRLKATDPTPRPQRKSWPTKELLESLGALVKSKGAVVIPAKWLWKSHADRHNTPPEPRAYKPVLLTPAGVPFFVLKDGAGNVVAKSGPKLPFADGRNRYYWPSFGYQIGDQPLSLEGNNRKFGMINPAFRVGDFRE